MVPLFLWFYLEKPGIVLTVFWLYLSIRNNNAGINDSFFIGSSICHVFRHLWNCHKKTGILRGPFDYNIIFSSTLPHLQNEKK